MITLGQAGLLAAAWYGSDRRQPDWERPGLEAARRIFQTAGLEGPFWELSG